MPCSGTSHFPGTHTRGRRGLGRVLQSPSPLSSVGLWSGHLPPPSDATLGGGGRQGLPL